jgi:hypothetical protein
MLRKWWGYTSHRQSGCAETGRVTTDEFVDFTVLTLVLPVAKIRP